MKFGVVVFPGSNCDHDVIHVCGEVLQSEVRTLWHKDDHVSDLSPTEDAIILPGGFSFGDYLRCGAIAHLSPIMGAVKNFADAGGIVFGICNGFQILCESGMLPGALLRNTNQLFICQNQYITAVHTDSSLTSELQVGKAYNIPIAHAEGRYYADEATLKDMYAQNQVLFQYCDENGSVIDSANPNGATDNIAGICNARKNVFGMMPHPERAAEAVLGNADGLALFHSLISSRLVAFNR